MANPGPALRVLLIVTARDEGGAERMAEDLVRALPTRCRFTVVVPASEEMKAFAARLAAHARVVSLPLGSARGLAASVARVRQLAREADLVHLNSNHPASRLAAILAMAVDRAAPLVSVEHSGTPPSAVRLPALFAPWAAPAFRLSRRHAATFVAVSDENARRLVNDYGLDASRVEVVHNGIDLPLFDVPAARRLARRRALGLADDDLVVIVPARQAPNKGHRFLIHAARQVVDALPRARFLLAGAGGSDPAVLAAIERQGLRDAFVDAGFLPHHEMVEATAGAEVLALPSLAEGFSVVLLEAMAAGAIPVATTVGGAAELITDGQDGFLVPPGQGDALAAALIRALRLGAAERQAFVARARARVASFSIEATAEKMLRVYERARRPLS